LIIRRRGCVRQWCRDCGREADMVSLSQAGLVTGVAQPLLLECARTERWHLIEAVAGEPLVCLESMLNVSGARSAGPQE
jgi:hypothetical protein